MRLRFTLNGTPRELEVEPLRRLLDVVRGEFALTGTKEGCGEGECGACSVLVDGVAVNSCLVPVAQVDGCEVVTIEGAGFERVREPFLAEGAAQCGICTPGMLVITRAWAERCRSEGREPTLDDARAALAGNLCRCTGYGAILRAALAVAKERQ